MVEYRIEDVESAARAAYRSSISGADDEYVERKSRAFVERCLAFDNGNANGISQAAVKEIAFQALDPYCTAQLYSVLDRLD